MAWDDAPPRWDELPPSPDELNPDQEKKPFMQAFNEITPTSLQRNEEPNKLNAASQNLGNKIFGGLAPQLQAKAQPITDRIYNAGNKLFNQPQVEPAPWSQLTSNSPEYVSARDQNIESLKNLQEQNPRSSMIGSAGGILATAPLMAAATPEIAGAGLLDKASQAAASGALMGAVENPGDVKGQVNPLQGQERLKNAGIGSLTGVASQGAAALGNKVVKVISGVPDFLKEFAQTRSAAATGLTGGQAAKAAKMDVFGDPGQTIKNLGSYATDNGIVKAGDTVKSVAKKSGEALKETGQKIGSVYQKALELRNDPKEWSLLSPEQQKDLTDNSLNPKQMVKEYLDQVKAKYYGENNGDEIIAAAEKSSNNFLNKGSADIVSVQKFKSDIGHEIYGAGPFVQPSEKPLIQAKSDFKDYLRDKLNSSIESLDRVFGTQLGGDLPKLNKDYNMLSTINNVAKTAYAKEEGNNLLGLRESGAVFGGAGLGASAGYKLGGVPGAIKGGIGGAVGGLLTKVGSKYGRANIAAGANVLANASKPMNYNMGDLAQKLQNNPGLIGAMGGASAPQSDINTKKSQKNNTRSLSGGKQ